MCEDYPLHSLTFKNGNLIPTDKINESDLFLLDIPEGCVINKLLQPDNLQYDQEGKPLYKISCCLLKQEMKK